MTAPAPQIVPEEGPGPRLHGAIDLIRPDRIAGWVIDRSDPAAHATVELRREGRVVARLPADRPRKDLASAGVGTGAYGFALPLDPPLEEGMEFTLAIRAFAPDGPEILLRPGGRHGASPERRALARLMEETAECRRLLETLAAPAPEVAAALGRVELVQARLESLGAGLEAPPPQPLTGLRLLAGAALGTALLSLALGLLSLWA